MFHLPFNTQQRNFAPRNCDKPHHSSGMIELFNIVFLFEQSSVANSCHFSARKHSPERMILFKVQSIVGIDDSSFAESVCKQRNG